MRPATRSLFKASRAMKLEELAPSPLMLFSLYLLRDSFRPLNLFQSTSPSAPAAPR